MPITVVSASDGELLTSLDNVKADLSISGSSDDTYLNRLIASASQTIAIFCNRTFGESRVRETVQGTGGRHLMTSLFPITTEFQIKYKDVEVSSDLYYLQSAAAGIYTSFTTWNFTANLFDYEIEYRIGS